MIRECENREKADNGPESKLGSAFYWRQPAKQEKVAAAKRASVGGEDPLQSPLDAISLANTSKVNGPAIGTASGEHTLL